MYVSSLMLVICLTISRFVVEILFLNFVVDSEYSLVVAGLRSNIELHFSNLEACLLCSDPLERR